MHPQGCQILNLDPLLFGLNHMPVKMALPAGLSPATRRFEAARSGTLSYGSVRRPCLAADSEFPTASAGGDKRGRIRRQRHPRRRTHGELGTSPLFFNLTSAPLKWWAATVLPRALRIKNPLHRCNACNPSGSQWSCSTTRMSAGPAGFQPAAARWSALASVRIGGPGWIRTINLPSQSRALF